MTQRAPRPSRELIGQLLQDWAELRDPELDPRLAALQLAILLEDALGVTLSDPELELDLLTDPAAVQRLVDRAGRAG